VFVAAMPEVTPSSDEGIVQLCVSGVLNGQWPSKEWFEGQGVLGASFVGVG